MKKILLLLVAVATIQFAQAQCNELFISEYVEGSAYNKAIEIYNPTANPVDLSDYRVLRFSNGGTSPSTTGGVQLTGTLQPYSTYVLANGQEEGTGNDQVHPDLVAKADQRCPGIYATNNTVYWNGNDAIGLEKISTEQLVDIFGVIGQDPGEGWYDVAPYTTSNFWEPWSADNVLIRKASIQQGVSSNPSEFNPSVEWDSIPEDTWTNLGSHDCTCDPDYSSIQEVQAYNIKVFPNPASNNSFMVTANTLIEEVELINTTGQVVHSQSEAVKTKNIWINAGRLPQGLYLVRIKLINQSFVSQSIILQ